MTAAAVEKSFISTVVKLHERLERGSVLLKLRGIKRDKVY